MTKGIKHRWFEALNEAGLLEEIESGWELPENFNGETPIRVGKTNPPPSNKIPVHERVTPAVGSNRIADNLNVPRETGSKEATSTIHQGFARAPSAGSGRSDSIPAVLAVDDKKGTEGFLESAHEEKKPQQSQSTLDYSSSALPDPDLPPDVIGDAISLPPEESDEDRMRQCFDIGDYSGALDIAEKLLGEDSGNKEAMTVKNECMETLMQMYEAHIGSFDRIPELLIDLKDILWRKLDNRAGFILSRIDGTVSFDDIIDMSGLPRFETCRIIHHLLQEKIIK